MEVQTLLEMARDEASLGNAQESKDLYENAIARSPSRKEQAVIRKEMTRGGSILIAYPINAIVPAGPWRRSLSFLHFSTS